jgi:hypothetical protein
MYLNCGSSLKSRSDSGNQASTDADASADAPLVVEPEKVTNTSTQREERESN